MIRRYDYGTPFPTGAIVQPLIAGEDKMPHFTVLREGRQVSFHYRMDEDDMIFGLGETVRGINKRGHLYRSWNSDDFSHTEDKHSLYASHNLVLFFRPGRRSVFGLYVDDPGPVTFDLGYTRGDQAVITSENGDFSAYCIEAGSLTGAAQEFRRMTGRSYLPPKWGLGYIQSRWGYASQEDLRTVVRSHRERQIPLDIVSMDIDYMEDYKNFTWSKENFPDLPGLIEELRQQHIRVMPIIDAGIKAEAGDPTYEEGMKKGYFCQKADGSVFVGAVWPGRAVFPDFLRPEVRTWFGQCCRRLLETGVEALWCDMNEPALFYSDEGLEQAFRTVDSLRGADIGVQDYFTLKDAFTRMANSPEDYRRFHHLVDGAPVRHDRAHNLYGAMMTRAVAQGMRAFRPGKRPLLFSRSSFIGAHRDGGVWQGDNFAWWSHLRLNLTQLAGLNLCGFLYSGADLGGFGGNTTGDLLLRWLQLGVFTPMMRNHAALGTRAQEIYQFDCWQQMRDVLTVRYALLPFLYSELVKAALEDHMLFRPLAFDYPLDITACRVEDQLMLGSACMIAPVLEQNARGRYVYLPEDMLLVRFRSAEDYDLTPYPKGHHWISLQTREFPLFIRRGQVIPLAQSAQYAAAVDASRLTLLGWVDGDVSFTLYDDDGESADPDLEKGLIRIEVCLSGPSPVARGKGLTLDAGKIFTPMRTK